MQLFQVDTWNDSIKCWNGHYITVPDFFIHEPQVLASYLFAVPTPEESRDRDTVLAWLNGMGERHKLSLYRWLTNK